MGLDGGGGIRVQLEWGGGKRRRKEGSAEAEMSGGTVRFRYGTMLRIDGVLVL